MVESIRRLRRLVLVLLAREIVAGGPESTAPTDSPPQPTEPPWTTPPPPTVSGLPTPWQGVLEPCRAVTYLFVELIELGRFSW